MTRAEDNAVRSHVGWAMQAGPMEDHQVQVICEEKHMGSRAVVVVCRDGDVAARRFKIDDPIAGTIYTRTGRAFFADPAWQDHRRRTNPCGDWRCRVVGRTRH